MGYGNYSYASRDVRTKALKGTKVLNIKTDDLAAANKLLNDHGFTNVNTGSHLTANVSSAAEATTINDFLASNGISASISHVDDSYISYANKSIGETFTHRQINNAMSPYGIGVRESRDSKEHPNSLGIIVALDETGSMGSVPHYLVRDGLPMLIDRIIKGGIPDPQVLFMGIGDHECDEAPLQVGQFESSDELMDKWLTDLYLEGRGGGNAGESYLLAWYFAAFHTAMDCFEKRRKKGYCITIGDEPTLKNIPERALKKLIGPGQYQSFSAFDLLNKAQETFHVYHLNISETASGRRASVKDGWKQLLADNFIDVQSKTQVAEIIASIILRNENTAQQYVPTESIKTDDSEMML